MNEDDPCLMNKVPPGYELYEVIPDWHSEFNEILMSWNRLSFEKREKYRAEIAKNAKSLGSGGP